MAAGLHCQYDNISGYKLQNYNAIHNIFVTIENLLAVSISFVGFGIQGGTVKFVVFAPPLNLLWRERTSGTYWILRVQVLN